MSYSGCASICLYVCVYVYNTTGVSNRILLPLRFAAHTHFPKYRLDYCSVSGASNLKGKADEMPSPSCA